MFLPSPHIYTMDCLAIYSKGTRFYPGIKQLRQEADHSPASTAKIKN
jgi:hypothetical protein